MNDFSSGDSHKLNGSFGLWLSPTFVRMSLSRLQWTQLTIFALWHLWGWRGHFTTSTEMRQGNLSSRTQLPSLSSSYFPFSLSPPASYIYMYIPLPSSSISSPSSSPFTSTPCLPPPHSLFSPSPPSLSLFLALGVASSTPQCMASRTPSLRPPSTSCTQSSSDSEPIRSLWTRATWRTKVSRTYSVCLPLSFSEPLVWVRLEHLLPTTQRHASPHIVSSISSTVSH